MTACQATQSQEKKVLFSTGMSAEYQYSLSTIKALVEHSDLIVKAKVTKVNSGYYSEDAYWFYFPAEAKVIDVFHGTYDKNKISFGYGHGYVSPEEYLKSHFAEGMDTGWYDELTPKERKDSLIEVQTDHANFLEKGREYLLFFIENEDGSYYPHSGGRGVLEIDGEYLNQTTGGHEFLLSDVLEQLRTGVYPAEETLPYSIDVAEPPKTFLNEYNHMIKVIPFCDQSMIFGEENMAENQTALDKETSLKKRRILKISFKTT